MSRFLVKVLSAEEFLRSWQWINALSVLLALVCSLALLKWLFYIRELVLTQKICRHKHAISLDVIFLKINDDERVVIMHHMYVFLVNKMLLGWTSTNYNSLIFFWNCSSLIPQKFTILITFLCNVMFKLFVYICHKVLESFTPKLGSW